MAFMIIGKDCPLYELDMSIKVRKQHWPVWITAGENWVQSVTTSCLLLHLLSAER